VAYDWRMLRLSLPLIYEHADVICLSLDKNRVSWSGEKFRFEDEAFREFLRGIDKYRKIAVMEDNFYLSELSPAQNEVRQRNKMAEFLAPGGWHIQLDADEYFVHFSSFVEYLNKLPLYQYRFNVCCPLITLFKKTENGYLFVNPERTGNVEYIQIASLHPSYQHGRRNIHFNKYVNFPIVHQSWARSEMEILQKLNSWGHVNDFDTKKYFDFWKSLNDQTYQSIRNFHPIRPTQWPSLRFVEATSVEEYINKLDRVNFPAMSKFGKFLRNSRLLSKARQLAKL